MSRELDKDRIGGMAFSNGIMLQTQKYKVRSKVNYDDQTVVITRTKRGTSEKSRRDRVNKIPVLRGMYMMLDMYLSLVSNIASSQLHKLTRAVLVPSFVFMVVFSVVNDLFPINSKDALRGSISSSLMLIGILTMFSVLTFGRRLLMFHGAEHKIINCFRESESEQDITLEKVKSSPSYAIRCGSAFLSVVLVINILLPLCGMLLHFRMPPLSFYLTCGVAYEIIMFLDSKWEKSIVRFLSQPFLWLQKIVIREPSDWQLLVAMMSLEALFVDDDKVEEHMYKKGFKIVEHEDD